MSDATPNSTSRPTWLVPECVSSCRTWKSRNRCRLTMLSTRPPNRSMARTRVAQEVEVEALGAAKREYTRWVLRPLSEVFFLNACVCVCMLSLYRRREDECLVFRRHIQQVNSLILFPTLNSTFPAVCTVQKCLLLRAPPSQADCEELFSLLGLYQVSRLILCLITCCVYTPLLYTPLQTGYTGESCDREEHGDTTLYPSQLPAESAECKGGCH